MTRLFKNPRRLGWTLMLAALGYIAVNAGGLIEVTTTPFMAIGLAVRDVLAFDAWTDLLPVAAFVGGYVALGKDCLARRRPCPFAE